MDKKRLALLEKAFDAEVSAALRGSPLHMMQTKSKLAEKLVEEGLLNKCSAAGYNMVIKGYELTNAGLMAYCMTCGEKGEG